MQKFLLQPLLLLCTLSVLAQPMPELIKDINPSAFVGGQGDAFGILGAVVLGELCGVVVVGDNTNHGMKITPRNGGLRAGWIWENKKNDNCRPLGWPR